jgi:hypothetical protein
MSTKQQPTRSQMQSLMLTQQMQQQSFAGIIYSLITPTFSLQTCTDYIYIALQIPDSLRSFQTITSNIDN